MENQRTRLTKQLIENAFIDLLYEKPLEKITVKEICEKAGINRSTFYTYYLDQFDLFDVMQKKAYSLIADYIETYREKCFERKNMVELFKTIQSNRHFLNVLLNGAGNYYTVNRQIIIALSDVWSKKRFVPTDKIFYYNGFFLVGFWGTVQSWVEQDCVLSPEDIADVVMCVLKVAQTAVPD